MFRARVVATTLLTICFLSLAVSGRNLTPFGEQNAILLGLQQALDQAGIDVRSNYSRPALKSTKASKQAKASPVLAPLEELPIQPQPEIWPELDRDFKRGAFGFVAATLSVASSAQEPSTPTAIARAGDLEQLRELWNSAAPDARIFLSFTRSDRKEAMRVRTVLAQNGYAVFTYVRESGVPPFSVEEVGKFFRTAGHRFVLDTPEARKSAGVWIEREVQERFKRLTVAEREIGLLKRDQARRKRWSEHRSLKSFVADQALRQNLAERADALVDFLNGSPLLEETRKELEALSLERTPLVHSLNRSPLSEATGNAAPSAPTSAEKLIALRAEFDHDFNSAYGRSKTTTCCRQVAPQSSFTQRSHFGNSLSGAGSLPEKDHWTLPMPGPRVVNKNDPAEVIAAESARRKGAKTRASSAIEPNEPEASHPRGHPAR